MRSVALRRIFFSLSFLSCGVLFGADHTKDSLEDVQGRLKDHSAVLIDVREQEEWDDGHLKQATHVPISQLKAGLTTEEIDKFFPKEKIIYLHCAAGGRSVKAAELLKASGRDLRALKPGYDALIEAGFPKAE